MARTWLRGVRLGRSFTHDTAGVLMTLTAPITYQWRRYGTAIEGISELVLRAETGEVDEVTRPGPIRLNLFFCDARLLLKG